MKYEDTFNRMVGECAAAGEMLSRAHTARGDHRPLYLWFRESTPTEPGGLMLDYARPGEEWKMAPGQGKGLLPSLPWMQYATWVRSRSRDLPILAPEKL
jgi:hypothetical protein